MKLYLRRRGPDRPSRPHPRWLPPIRLLLTFVMLPPILGMAVLATSAATTRWDQRGAADAMARDAVELDRLIVLRGDIAAEHVSAASVTTGTDLGIAPARLSALYRIDFIGRMRLERDKVDADPTVTTYPDLAADLARLRRLRSEIDAGHSGFAAVEVLFARFEADINRHWRSRFDDARRIEITAVHGVGSASDQLDVVEATFTAFNAALARTSFTNAVLTGHKTQANIEAVIAANTRFSTAVANFSDRLGPRATIAWREVQADPDSRHFDAVVDEAIRVGVGGARSALSSDPTAYGAALIAAGQWVVDLTRVNAAASIDLNDRVRLLGASAQRAFLIATTGASVAIVLAAVAAALTARAVARPARRLASFARRISDGEFSIPPLARNGVRELAETSRALNDLTATLAALEQYALTLAGDPTSPTLNQRLPGPTGAALQATVDQLRDSVHERERHRLELQEAATHDTLTGLLNRGAAMDAIERDVARSQRDETNMMILFIDLDAFKNINDTYGHHVGDAALRLAAEALRAATRQSDVVARIGGDEFLVAGVASGPEEMEHIAQRVHDAISSQSVSSEGRRIAIDNSIGIASIQLGDTAESVIRNADEALYRAKRRGRNQVAWNRPDLSRTSG